MIGSVIPEDNSTEARLRAFIESKKAICNIIAHEIRDKRLDLEAERTRRRWAEAMLRQHRVGDFHLPEPKETK